MSVGSSSSGRCENTALTIRAQRFDLETNAQKNVSCLGYLFLWIPQHQDTECFMPTTSLNFSNEPAQMFHH